jgi:RND superfamily putative drug exporter
MFARLGAVVVHNPWKVIGLWVLLAIAVVATAPELKSTTDQSDFLPSHYESIQALELQQRAFPESSAPAAIIVFARKDGAPLTEADSASVVAVAADLRGAKVKDVTAIQPAPPSENRLIQIIAVQMTKVTNPSDTTQGDAVKALRTRLKESVADTDLKAGITGQAAQVLDPGATADHLPQPGDRVVADRRDRRDLQHGRRIDRHGRQSLRPADRRIDQRHPGGRAVRCRHRLHPVPDVPLPRAVARG